MIKVIEKKPYGVIELYIGIDILGSSSLPGEILKQINQVIGHQNWDELFKLGAIYQNDIRLRNPTDLKPNSRLRVFTIPRRFFEIQNLRPLIRYEDPDIIVVDKPAGLPSHSLVDNCFEDLASQMSRAFEQKFFVTHRLDIETSGLIIFAKNQKAQAQVNLSLKEKRIRRFYEGFVQHKLESGMYTHYMLDSMKAPKQLLNFEQPGTKKCLLRIQACEPVKAPSLSDQQMINKFGDLKNIFKVQVELMTGRPHQIRAQLSALGAPLLGDTIYSSPHSALSGIREIALKAVKIHFLDQGFEVANV